MIHKGENYSVKCRNIIFATEPYFLYHESFVMYQLTRMKLLYSEDIFCGSIPKMRQNLIDSMSFFCRYKK